MPETLQPTRFRRPNTQGRGDLLRQRFAEPRFGGSSQGTTPRRPLRETHSALLATYFVGPLIAGFRRLHPAIRFELGAGSWGLPSIENHDITLLSTNEGCDGSIVARRTLTVEAVLVASPACLARKGVPQHPQDLSDHDCLRWRLPGLRPRDWRLRRADPAGAAEIAAVADEQVLDA